MGKTQTILTEVMNMLTIDEIKAKLAASDEEGADKATIYDEVLSDIADTYNKITEMEKAKAETDTKLSELSDKANELTQTNLKLLDKIKYVEPDKETHDDDKKDEVEIADLSTWYDEE